MCDNELAARKAPWAGVAPAMVAVAVGQGSRPELESAMPEAVKSPTSFYWTAAKEVGAVTSRSPQRLVQNCRSEFLKEHDQASSPHSSILSVCQLAPEGLADAPGRSTATYEALAGKVLTQQPPV